MPPLWADASDRFVPEEKTNESPIRGRETRFSHTRGRRPVGSDGRRTDQPVAAD